MGRFREADLSRLATGSVGERPTRVRVEEFARPLDPAAARALIDSFPHQLAAEALREVVRRTVAAARAERPIIAMCGGHVVKVGVSPCLIELIDAGAIRHLALNGSTALHDVEIARFGRTSEDVESHLHQGRFGMVDETGDFMCAALREARARAEGLGECWGRALEKEAAPHRAVSLLAAAHRAGIPATVHVAIGTDTIHHHPGCDGALLGEASLRDFRVMAGTLADAKGAVVLNVGSAVMLPEVFLKALSVARNLGADLSGLTTVNFDQIQHYRPRVNVVERPTRGAGAKGYAITGHHEIMIPLFAGAVLAELKKGQTKGARRSPPLASGASKGRRSQGRSVTRASSARRRPSMVRAGRSR